MSQDIDWKALSDHLFEKSDELHREMSGIPAQNQAILGTAAVVLNALAKGIQKAIAHTPQQGGTANE